MSFTSALNSKDFVVTAQLSLADLSDKASLVRGAEVLASAVDAVQLPDSTEVHTSGIAAAAILLQHGVDPVVHLNCRDRNRIALHKDVLGAVALGVTSMLIMRGKAIPDSKKQGVRAVYDIPALDFMAQLQELKQNDDAPLNSDFFIGAAAEIFDPDPDWTPRNLIKKCDAGANFVQTQVCFDLQTARNYMQKMVAAWLTHQVRFMLALSPLPSAAVARWVQGNIDGAILPDDIVKRLEQSKQPAQEGIEICAELIRSMAKIPGVAGVNLLNFGELDAIAATVAAAELTD